MNENFFCKTGWKRACCFSHSQALSLFKCFCVYMCVHRYWNWLFFRCHLGSKRSIYNVEIVLQWKYRRQLQVKRRHPQQHVPRPGGAELSSASFEDEVEEDVSKETLIWRAIKLPMYSVALVPLTVSIRTLYPACSLLSWA